MVVAHPPKLWRYPSNLNSQGNCHLIAGQRVKRCAPMIVDDRGSRALILP
jgi:hypothetical protein